MPSTKIRQLHPRRAEQRPSLIEGEPEVGRADLGQLAFKPQPVQAEPQIVPGGQHDPQLLRAAHQQQLQLALRLGRAQLVGIVNQQPGRVLQRLQVRQQPLDDRPAIQIWCRGQRPHQRRTGRGLPERIEY
jgi:hypothetical protein